MLDPCERCPEHKTCGGRSESSRKLPRDTTLKLSIYEKSKGETEEHYAIIINEVGLYSPKRTSGDACRVIQEMEWGGDKYLRLGYYVRNPDIKKWI